MRLIDADELYEKKHAALKEGEVLYRFTPRDIDNAETVDAVPVVRCRECKHNDGKKLICSLTGVYFLEDDFCSRGERR